MSGLHLSMPGRITPFYQAVVKAGVIPVTGRRWAALRRRRIPPRSNPHKTAKMTMATIRMIEKANPKRAQIMATVSKARVP
jgi:hypothetical protein